MKEGGPIGPPSFIRTLIVETNAGGEALTGRNVHDSRLALDKDLRKELSGVSG